MTLEAQLKDAHASKYKKPKQRVKIAFTGQRHCPECGGKLFRDSSYRESCGMVGLFCKGCWFQHYWILKKRNVVKEAKT